MSPGASAILTLSQSASISSATMAARPVAVPWPNSMCLEMTVTVPVGSILMKGPKAPKSSLGAPSEKIWVGEQAPTRSEPPTTLAPIIISRRLTPWASVWGSRRRIVRLERMGRFSGCGVDG